MVRVLKEITPDVIKEIQANLTEFGYQGLTYEIVESQIVKIREGEQPSIIGMFARDMLIENGFIEED